MRPKIDSVLDSVSSQAKGVRTVTIPWFTLKVIYILGNGHEYVKLAREISQHYALVIGTLFDLDRGLLEFRDRLRGRDVHLECLSGRKLG